MRPGDTMTWLLVLLATVLVLLLFFGLVPGRCIGCRKLRWCKGLDRLDIEGHFW